jgi:hypothetical protein
LLSTAQPLDVINPGDVHIAVNVKGPGAGVYNGLYSAIRQCAETLEWQVRDLTANMFSQKSMETRECARTLLFASHKLDARVEITVVL